MEFDPLIYPGYAHRNTIGFVKVKHFSSTKSQSIPRLWTELRLINRVGRPQGLSTDFNQDLSKQNCKTFIFGIKREIERVQQEQVKAKEAKIMANLGHGKKKRRREAALRKQKRKRGPTAAPARGKNRRVK